MDRRWFVLILLLLIGGALSADQAENKIQVKKLTDDDIITSVLHQPAQFGPSLPSDGLRGVVAGADPYHACGPVQPPPEQRNVTWIAVAGHGSCTFSQQVINVEKAGYLAVIIHNVPGKEKYMKMLDKSGKAEVHIPAVSVGYSQGRMLVERFGYENRDVEVEILVASEATYILRFVLPFVGIMVVPCLCLFVSMIIKRSRARASARARDRAAALRAWDEEEAIILERQQRIAEVIAEHLRSSHWQTIEEWTEDEEEHPPLSLSERCFNEGDYQDSCSICLENFKCNETLQVLPCEHTFHPKCIGTWLREHTLCPLCKRSVYDGACDEQD